MCRLITPFTRSFLWLVIVSSYLPAMAGVPPLGKEPGRVPGRPAGPQPCRPERLAEDDFFVRAVPSDDSSAAAESDGSRRQYRSLVGRFSEPLTAIRATAGRVPFLVELAAFNWGVTFTPSCEFCIVLRRFRI